MAMLVHFSPLFTGAFVAGLWQGLAIALMGAALCWLLPHASASLRHAMLLGLFVGALILPWIGITGSSGGEATHGFQIAPWISDLIALFWMSFATFRAIQLYLAWRHLCGVRGRATPIEVQGMAELHGGRRSAMLCSSAEVDSPSILGFGSPKLLLPEWMVPELSQAELQHIALHECEHLRRSDDWTNLLLQVGIVLAPLNPALLWINNRIRLQRELAVDAAVVAHTAQPISYANCLRHLAEQKRQRGRVRLGLAALSRRSELVQRVQVLLDCPSFWTGPQSAWAAGAVALVLLSVGTVMARAPHFVHVGRFESETQTTQLPAKVAPLLASGVPLLTSGAQMVPVTFHVGARQPTSSLTTRVGMAHQQIHSSTDRRPAARSRKVTTPNRARVQVSVRWLNVTSPRQTNPYIDTRVRFMTVNFYAPYVALPTLNGWVFIEL